MSDSTMSQVMVHLDDILDDLDAIPRIGFATYRRIPAELLIEHEARSRANCTYDHMMAEAHRRFIGRQGMRLIEIRGLKVWAIEDHTVIRFKKMDDEGRSRNYQTKQAKAYDRGESFPEISAPAVRLTVGYLADATATSIDRVQVALISGRRVAWCAAIIPPASRADGSAKWADVTKQSDILGFG